MADLGGRTRRAPPVRTKISLISWGFSENITKILGRRPPPQGLAPPPRKSSGSAPDRGKKGIHHGFETQGRRHQSKTGVSVTPRKGLMSSKILKKRTVIFGTRYETVNRIYIWSINFQIFLILRNHLHLLW